MQSARTITEKLAHGADVITKMGSPFFGSLLERASQAYETDIVLQRLLAAHAHRSRIFLRLGGAAHFRALRGYAPEIAAHYPSTGGDCHADAAWDAIVADIHANAAEYDELLARPVQTNEVARSMPVLGAMLAVARATDLPLRLFEIGSSAGLNLNFDRYYYAAHGWRWGDPASRVHLRNRTVSGAPAYLDARLRISERLGCDVNPLNARDPEDADTLLSFVWPDQMERFERLRAALSIACEHPLQIARGDGIEWVRRSAVPVAHAVTVVMHTVMTEHLTNAERSALRVSIEELAARASADAPLAWARMEPGERGYATTVTLWPGADELLVATSDGHAQALKWIGALGRKTTSCRPGMHDILSAREGA